MTGPPFPLGDLPYSPVVRILIGVSCLILVLLILMEAYIQRRRRR